MAREKEWITGDSSLARKAWWGRIDYAGLLAGLSFVAWLVVVGLLSGPVERWQERTWHGDAPIDYTKLFALSVFVIPVLVTAVFIWCRLRNRPSDLLAVSAKEWQIQLMAFPDSTDSDGDPVRHDVNYLLFRPDINRTVNLLIRDEDNADNMRMGTFTVRDGAIRLDNISDYLPNTGEQGDEDYQLAPGLSYDSDSLTIMNVPSEASTSGSNA